jgi:CheY-like chemotaxis protein
MLGSGGSRRWKNKPVILFLDNLLLSYESYTEDNYYDGNTSNNNNNNENRISQKADNRDYVNEDKPLSSLGRLLVVDDDPDILYLLKTGLQNNGFLVDAFTNPKEALLRFKSNPKDFSLVLSDFKMDELSGIELARQVKETNPDVKVMVITAFEIMDKSSLSLHGVDGFVRKPIGIKELTDSILKLIGQTKKRKGQDDEEK